MAVEPLAPSNVDPTTLVSRLWNNASNGRQSLFVLGDDGDGDEVAAAGARILARPPLVRAETDVGCRTFYNGPDRIHLAEGGYAAHRTDSAAFRWHEEEATDPVGGRLEPDDRKRLVLRDCGGESAEERPDASSSGGDGRTASGRGSVVCILDGVDALSRPRASAFPYAYARNPVDRRIHVRNANGREVGVYGTIAAMRADAYAPVPMPLVPERIFREVGSARDRWAFVVGPEAETGESRAYTAGGRERM